MATRIADAPARVATDSRRAVRLSLLGGVLGFAWAAGLRGFMAQIARDESNVSWSGTFGWVLLPGLLIGLLLGSRSRLTACNGYQPPPARTTDKERELREYRNS